MVQIVLVLFSAILFLFAPEQYDVSYCVMCSVVFLMQAWFVIRKDIKEEGWLNYNLLFLVTSWVVLFFYPIFLYSGLTNSSHLYVFSVFRESSICRVTALSTFAYSIYMASYYYNKKTSSVTKHYSFSKKGLSFLHILSILVTVLFTINMIVFVARNKGAINLDTNTFIFEIAKSVLTVDLLVSCYRNREEIQGSTKSFLNKTRTSLLCLLLISLEFLYIGDRGFVIVACLTVAACYNFFVKKFKVTLLIPAIVIGVIFMSLVSAIRLSEYSFQRGGVSSFFKESKNVIQEFRGSDDYSYLFDLTVVSSVSYIGYDYKQVNGYYKPSRFFVILASPIPKFPSLLSELFYGGDNESASTGAAITGRFRDLSNSYNSNAGLGTQIVVDIYMSWGVLGVVLLFYLFGSIIAKAVARKDNPIWFIVFLSCFGFAVYQPRSTIYQSYRTIVWDILIIYTILRPTVTVVHNQLFRKNDSISL